MKRNFVKLGATAVFLIAAKVGGDYGLDRIEHNHKVSSCAGPSVNSSANHTYYQFNIFSLGDNAPYKCDESNPNGYINLDGA